MRDENRLNTMWQCNDLTFTSHYKSASNKPHCIIRVHYGLQPKCHTSMFYSSFSVNCQKRVSKEIFFCQIKNEGEAKKSRLYHTIACQFITMLTY